MKIGCIINNYTLGAKLKSTPTHKIIKKERQDKSHTFVCYDNITEKERNFIEKILQVKTCKIK